MNWNEKSKKAWDKSWGINQMAGTIGTLGGAASDIVGAGFNNAKLADTSIQENQIDDLAYASFEDYGDYDSLQNSFSTDNLAKDNYSWQDIRGGSNGQRAFNTGKAGLSGAISGTQVGGPWGAIIGAAVGLAGGAAGWLAGDARAKNKALKLNTEATLANNRYIDSFSSSAGNLGNKMFNSAALNLAAFGGMLKDNTIDNFTKSKIRLRAFGGDMMTNSEADDFSNGVVVIKEGGSHEENPYGGVLMGVDNEGNPNLVEEDEVIFNDYVFSKRFKAPKRLLKEVNLPEKYANKPISEVAKKISQESEERPNDPISRNGLIDSMMKLTTVQEEIRQQDRNNLKKKTFAKGGNILKGEDETQTLSGKPSWMSDNLWNKRQQIMSDINNFNVDDASDSYPSWDTVQTWARYAPLVGSGIQALSDAVGWTNENDYSNASLIRNAARKIRPVSSRPVSGYLSYNPFALNYEQTLLRNQALAAQRGILDLSGGNRGTARNNLVAFNYNTGLQMGDLAKKAREYNDTQRKAVAEFNFNIDQLNSQLGMRADAANQDRDKAIADAAYREAILRDQIETATSTAKSANQTNFWNNLGLVGKEAAYRRTARGMARSGVYGIGADRYYDNVVLAKGGKLKRGRKEFYI